MNEEEAVDEAVDSIDFLSIQFKNCQEENRTLKGEQEKL